MQRVTTASAWVMALIGMLAGALFPLIAFVITAHHDKVAIAHVIWKHEDPLLYLIDLGPLILGLIGYIAGLRNIQIKRLQDDLTSRRLEDAEIVGQYGSWIQNMNSGSVTWSRGFFRLLDLEFDQALVSTAYFDTLLDTESVARGHELGQKLMSGEVTSFEVELKLNLPSGKTKWVLSKGAVLPPTEPGGDPVLVGTTRDITAIVQAREAARAAQASLSRVEGIHATIVTYRHEINTPLTVAIHAIDEIAEQSPANPYVKRAQKALDQITVLLKTLDRISKQEKIELTSYGRSNESRLLVDKTPIRKV